MFRGLILYTVVVMSITTDALGSPDLLSYSTISLALQHCTTPPY